MRTAFYIDGFNLYFGCFRNDRYPDHRFYKWLDLAAFCQVARRRDTIDRIRYFTARVNPTRRDPDKPLRQQVYLRALATIPTVSIHEGRCIPTVKRGYELDERGNVTPRFTRIQTSEEKGSDVNLATHLLLDAFDRDFELAVVVSNDSDLVEPIAVVRRRFGLPVGVLNPTSNYSGALERVASFYGQVPRAELANCQFPEVMSDVQGTFVRPSAWATPVNRPSA